MRSVNPLENVGEPVEFSGMNPNPGYRPKGPVYTISLEVGRDDWDLFADTTLEDKRFRFQLAVQECHQPLDSAHDNPLFAGKPLEFDGSNARPSYGRRNDVSIYRLQLEISEHIWQHFNAAHEAKATQGMIIGGRVMRLSPPPAAMDESREQAGDQLKGGRLAKGAALQATRAPFQDFLRTLPEFAGMMRGDDPVKAATEVIRRYCGVTSRRELDHNEQAAQAYRRLLTRFNRWILDQRAGRHPPRQPVATTPSTLSAARPNGIRRLFRPG